MLLFTSPLSEEGEGKELGRKGPEEEEGCEKRCRHQIRTKPSERKKEIKNERERSLHDTVFCHLLASPFLFSQWFRMCNELREVTLFIS